MPKSYPNKRHYFANIQILKKFCVHSIHLYIVYLRIMPECVLVILFYSTSLWNSSYECVLRNENSVQLFFFFFSGNKMEKNQNPPNTNVLDMYRRYIYIQYIYFIERGWTSKSHTQKAKWHNWGTIETLLSNLCEHCEFI